MAQVNKGAETSEQFLFCLGSGGITSSNSPKKKFKESSISINLIYKLE